MSNVYNLLTVTSTTFCRILELNTGVPARVVDEAVAVYRVVKGRKIAAMKVHVNKRQEK